MLRWLLRPFQAKPLTTRLSPNDAEGLARAVATEEKWTWLEPVTVHVTAHREHGPVWEVTSNQLGIGTNVRIQIRDRDGLVLHKAFLPR